MSITVTKSSPVLVGPSSEPAAPPIGHINLSPFDKQLAFFPMTSFHVFTGAIPEPAGTVRRALSQALVHYFPVAGRLDANLRIACTGEGVSFVAASANCSLEDVKLLDPPFGAALLKELAVSLGGKAFGESDPLLFVQVTEFSCGGFVLGVTRNHAIADGTGFAQFLQAVGELARGLPQPTVLPISYGVDSLPELPPFRKARAEEPEPQGFAYLDITVPSRCINRIKAGFAGDGEPCTVLEAVMAVLWRCRTRVVMSTTSTDDAEAPAPLKFPVNLRKQVGAKPGYYGNCTKPAVAVPKAGEVANGDINDVVKLIKAAKKRTVSAYFHQLNKQEGGGRISSTSSMEQQQQLDDDDEDQQQPFGYSALVVSSWRNLGSDLVDFGGGSPARVMCIMERSGVPNSVACLPYKGKDGANVLARCVKHEHVQAFREELAKFVM